MIRIVSAFAAIAFIALGIVLHLLSHEHAAELCGNIAFFALVAAVLAPAPPSENELVPDAQRDRALYESHYADALSARSFESASKADLFAALTRKAGIDVRGVNACDVGFGSGLILQYLRDRGAGSLAGAELSTTAVAMLTERYPQMDLRPESAERTSFKTGQFDVVTCSHVLEHVEDQDATLAELARITCSGGIAIVGVPGAGSQPDPRHFRVYSKEALENALRAHDFTPFAAIVAGSRLVQILTPRATFATRAELEAARRSVVYQLVRRVYHALGVPMLRALYAASIRGEERGIVNEVWVACRRT